MEISFFNQKIARDPNKCIQFLDIGPESLAFDHGANGSNIDPDFLPFSVMCVSSDGL